MPHLGANVPHQQLQPTQPTPGGLLTGEQGPVVDIFARTLGRAPDAAGLEFWRQQLAAGRPIEQIQAAIAASSEGSQRGAATQIPTGLLGAEQALQGGLAGAISGLTEGIDVARGDIRGALQGATGAIQQGGQQVGQQIGQGVAGLDPFAQPGGQAINLQAALLGAAGPEAQAQAFANFQDSPGQQFLEDRGERAVLRNRAATGGLGGGRVLQELQRQGIGFANQALGQRLGQLGQVSGLGLQAAGQQAGLRGQQAGISGALAGQLGQFNQATGQQLGGIAERGGQNAAQLAFQTGQSLAGGRTRVGEQLAGAVGSTTSALSDLVNQQGAGLSDIVGASTGNLANILSGAGQQQAAGQTQTATILANLAAQQGSQVAGLPGIPGVTETGGILGEIGQLAGGIGTAIAAPALLASDSRLKENIRPVGTSRGGYNLYTWDWNAEGRRIAGDVLGFGVLADEVRGIDPEAVVVGDHGYMMVDYARVH